MKDARRFFDAIARRYDRVYAIDARLSRERMRRVIAELPERARLLDLGVGTGRELSALQDAGFDVTGVDVSPEMIAIASRRARPIPITEHDFWRALPFGDATFDAAIALHGTLAHPPEDGAYARLFAEIARVLAPRGVFVAEVPARAWLERLPVGASAEHDGRRVRRTSDDRCVYDDLVANVSIEAFIPDDARWPELAGDAFDVRTDPIGAQGEERLVVARKRS